MQKLYAAAGHYYSPIGNREELRNYWRSPHLEAQFRRVDRLLDWDKLMNTWASLFPEMLDFPFEQSERFRYYAKNSQFLIMDAMVLSAMIGRINPRRIVEIGAGFSTACMFDKIDRMDNSRLEKFTTIDIDLTRVKGLNPPQALEMIEAPVQTVPISFFEELEAGDMLFIDSSHVLKTGIDVHYDYLHILPAIKRGVHVHIHDIHYPFEYPRYWAVKENRSWNEVYLVDTMLTFGHAFEVELFNSALAIRKNQELRAMGNVVERMESLISGDFSVGAGSLYLRKT